ncbi:MAG: M28 family metallopeptidase [candidate division KSB1 bacterium]|nr:M28 family metallopeptidase [candidate division KSB1 bacterium]MDZ7318836.1 M28 family metallopeptidase [candidate division KSB1 bacterium]MDZ7340450.1 M28 family metallopeptidase [candidate division KSB1 bacterium]
MRIRRFVGELCIFKHRASATKNEHKAAEHIHQIMRSIGLVSKIEAFKSQQRMTWELITIMGFFILEVVLYFYLPWLAVIAGAMGLILFWGYFTTAFKPLAKLFRFSTSHNVVGKLINSNAPYKVIFTAHYDTARSGPLWNPKTVANFRLNFLVGVWILVALQFLTILNLFSINPLVLRLLVAIGGLYVLGNIAVLLYSGLRGELVQGASDNATGVAAMLDIAARLKDLAMPGIEFWFVATGSEEVGAIGMAEFLKMHAEDLDKQTTYFINLDNIGSGQLHYFTGEGMLNFYRFSDDLIFVAEKSALDSTFRGIIPAKYRLAYTDAIVPARRGYHAMLLLSLDERGLIPNWHWPSDTIENVNFSLPELASDFVLEMVHNLDEILKRRLERRKKEISQFQEELGESIL